MSWSKPQIEQASPLYGHPFGQRNPRSGYSSLNGLSQGRISKVDPKTLICEVEPFEKRAPSLIGRLSYAYCHPYPACGILAVPQVGANVVYQESVHDGRIYANILGYIAGNIFTADYDPSTGIPRQNPGFERYGSVYDGTVSEPKDYGLLPGDMGIFGPKRKQGKSF